MIVDFSKYTLKENTSVPADIIICPNTDVVIRRGANNAVVLNFHGDIESIWVYFDNDAEASKLLFDLNKFLQYRDHELPEYLL